MADTARKTETAYATGCGTGLLVWSGTTLLGHQLPGTADTESGQAAAAPAVASPVQLELGRMLAAYFRGDIGAVTVEAAGAELPLATLSPFERAVVAALTATAPGDLVSYGELAHAAGYTGAARAVGNFMAKNPWPIIVPCHRVIRSDGAIGGFACGREWKERLIALEQRVTAGSRGVDAALAAPPYGESGCQLIG